MSVEFKATCDTIAELHRIMQDEINRAKPNRLKTFDFWIGFIWGAVIIASLGYGDVHVCAGACKGIPSQNNEATK